MTSMLVVDVYLRDVLESLITGDCRSITDFSWTKQLRYSVKHTLNQIYSLYISNRYYWEDDDCMVRQASATFGYGYEYLGNTPRLVVTPLTEK